MKKTALLYSPKGGSVDQVAVKLGEVIGTNKVDLLPVSDVNKDELKKYTQIIFVGSTVGADHWSNETIEDEWLAFFRNAEDISFEDKKTAIVGLGNSVLYPEHFANGMAHLYKSITEKKAKVFGFVDSKGYSFTDSEALNDDGLFCGLPIDEDNEEDLTTERLEKWIDTLKADFDL